MRIRNLDADPKAQTRMSTWRSSVASNGDGTWTYKLSAGNSSLSVLHNINATASVFVVDMAAGNPEALSSENKSRLLAIGTMQGHYRVFQFAGGSSTAMLFAGDVFNPVGFAGFQQADYDVLHDAGLPLVFSSDSCLY